MHGNKSVSARGSQEDTTTPVAVSEEARSAASHRKAAVLAIGMHRSGISALAGVLGLLGCTLPKRIARSASDNEHAMVEPEGVRDLNAEILESGGSRWDDWEPFNPDWYRSPVAQEFRQRALKVLDAEFGTSRLFVLTDPKICRLLPFWIDALKDFEADPYIICMMRNPLEIAGSLEASSRIDQSVAHLVWLRHVLDAESTSRSYPRVFVRYEDLLEEWEAMTGRVSAQLGLIWPRQARATAWEIEEFLSPDLRHHASTDSAVFKKLRLSPWIRRSFAILSRWARDESRQDDEHELDSIKAAFDEAAWAFGRSVRVGQEAARRVQALERATEKLKMREADVAKLTKDLMARKAELRKINEELAKQQLRTGELVAELASGEAEIGRLRKQFEATARTREQLARQIADIERSTSWRITEPIRAVKGVFQRPAPTGIAAAPLTDAMAKQMGAATAAGPIPSAKSEERSSQPASSPGKAGELAAPAKPGKGRPVARQPPRPQRAERLEDKLWGGFSRYALGDLEEMKRSSHAAPEDVSHAAWALARWYAVRQDYERALDNLLVARKAHDGRQMELNYALLEADCLRRIGRIDSARAILMPLLDEWPDRPNLCLTMANTYIGEGGSIDSEADAARLGWINRIYAKAKLAPLTKADPSQPLGFHNLAAAAEPPADSTGQPKISVIMPVYNAQGTLSTALRGLQAQTWRNLEIIIVDDCSTDNTLAIAYEAAEADPRIIGARQTENRGAYVARNRGVELATGDFITTHDADDWSHPQRLELQVTRLMDSRDLVANYSDWSRAQASLEFTGTFRGPSSVISENLSALIFGRELARRLGGWDQVRVSADREMLNRIQRLAGKEAVRRIMQSTPLAFALDEDTSLTRAPATHVKSIYHGIRREYHAAAEFWYSVCVPEDLRIGPAATQRAFPVPGPILPDRDEVLECDVMVIMDYNLGGGAYHSTMNYIDAAIAHGLSVAVFHWRRYDLDVMKPLNRDVRRMAHEGKIRIVAAGERVRVAAVIAVYPVLLHYAIDLCPQIEFKNFIVVVNQMAARLYSGGDVQYDPLAVRANLKELFGTEGSWAPVSEHVRQLMEADKRYPVPHFQTWTALINTGKWCARPPAWRGRDRRLPVVGRHGRDHYTKWPSQAEALKAAYCAGRPCKVSILGGAARAFDVIGQAPENWSVQEFGSGDVNAFLGELDFYIHYPNEDYIEEGARGVIEALATGIPVILPPVFRDHFADAALYVEPAQVWPTIEGLWRDEAAYLERVEAGRQFVRANCGWEQLPARLEELQLASPAAVG